MSSPEPANRSKSIEAMRALPEALREGLSGGHLPKLDGLRAIAAFLVVFNHYGFTHIPAGKGVLIFFVLSGFLITWLLLKENESTGKVSLKKFYLRRSLRIFPAFYCYWILVTGMQVFLHRKVLWPQAIASFLYVCNYYQGLNHYPSSPYSHTWSLAIEEQFYLLWPALFVLLRKDPRRLLLATTGIIAMVWICRTICAAVFDVPEEYLYTAFEMRADHLLSGCLLALLLRGGHLAGLWARLCANQAWLFLTVALLVASSIIETTVGHGYRDRLGAAVNPVLVVLLIPQLIAHRGAAVAWLDHPWVRYLGTISYPVYLYQQLAIGPTKSALLRMGMPGPVVFVGAIGAVIACAAASYQLVEKPFLKLKSRFAV